MKDLKVNKQRTHPCPVSPALAQALSEITQSAFTNLLLFFVVIIIKSKSFYYLLFLLVIESFFIIRYCCYVVCTIAGAVPLMKNLFKTILYEFLVFYSDALVWWFVTFCPGVCYFRWVWVTKCDRILICSGNF